MGIAVPAAPERFTEVNIETATTRPKAGECHASPIAPTTAAHTTPMMLEVCTCRRTGSHHRSR